MSNQNFPGATATAEGMSFKGATFSPVIENCEGCGRVKEFEGKNYCSSYATPQAKWAMGNCNFATHVSKEIKAQGKVNPLKASKRSSKGK